MNLVIDSGNTQTKIGVFDKGILRSSLSVKFVDQLIIDDILCQYPIQRAIIGSVSSDPDRVVQWLAEKGVPAMVAQPGMAVPFENAYKTISTLGIDRLAAVAGGHSLYPGENLLLIDAGTAITYEFFSGEAIYFGGAISPGMKMRFKALHHFTQKLPLADSAEFCNLVGTSTLEALASGVISGISFEMEGYRGYMEKQFGSFQTIITGGDAVFFAEKLKNPIFVNLNLVLIGLNRLLDYNA